MLDKLKVLLFGAPRDLEDPQVHHRMALIAFLAWVGLGADGLSSSCYGPEESFKMLGTHHYMAVLLALAVAATVFIISYAYSRVIEHFPFGGGGYVVSSKLLGPNAGVVSGSALLIDYVLTISTSIAAGADAFFSFLPLHYQHFKLPIEFAAIMLLSGLNLRGVKESVTAMMPIFLTFVLTHLILIFGTVFLKLGEFPAVAHEVHSGFHLDLGTIGLAGMAALFLRAYSMGAGTYTGIEAVSNGLSIMREPKVQTGQRTMIYMAISLAVTAGGITLGYLLVHAAPEAGRTMNAVLTDRFIEALGWTGRHRAHLFTIVTLFSEAALLFVAAQAGFIDGPRVMANMAHDSWLPHRFATLSDRLTMQDGVLLMGGASLMTLAYTHGDITTLVLMYSINVFITFCLTETSMIRFWWQKYKHSGNMGREIYVHITGFCLCFFILMVNIFEKFSEGGWVTLTLTATLVVLCAVIKRHYGWVKRNLSRLDEIMTALPSDGPAQKVALDPKAPTAVLLVGGYGGLGVHSLLAIQRLFPNYFKNFIFVSVGTIDSATFKGVEAVEEVREYTEQSLQSYVELARRWGLAADYRMAVSTEVLEEAEHICLDVSHDYPRSIVFAGKLVFQHEAWFQRLLHNETAYQLQRRLQFSGLNTMVLPVRVLSPVTA
ncbi:MAG: APC family permease [Elusimicrobia bacterium]|nr:APC family permease [Elusimicrobiota bacterium]